MLMNKSIINLGLGLLIVILVVLGFYYLPQKSPPSQPNGKETVAKEKPVPKPEFTVIFGGDVVPGRMVQETVYNSGDFALPFRSIADVISSADLTYFNFESPFRTDAPRTREGMVFGTRPELAAMLDLAGVDIVSLANNHIGDQGKAGVKETIEILDKRGIKHAGLGLNLDEARQPAITEVKGVKIGWLSYQNIAAYYYADAETAGTTSMNLEYLKEDIAKLKPQVDYLIIAMHSGTEYQATPRQDQEDFAHAAIDAGADFVMGNHPHWVERYENYNGKPIFYAAGNLVFDQEWSQETKEGVLLRAHFVGNRLKSVDVLPHLIVNFNQPREATLDSPTGKRVLEQMGIESGEIIL